MNISLGTIIQLIIISLGYTSRIDQQGWNNPRPPWSWENISRNQTNRDPVEPGEPLDSSHCCDHLQEPCSG